MATRRRQSVSVANARADRALLLIRSGVGALSAILTKNGYSVRPYSVKNVDATVDGAVHTTSTEELGYRDGVHFLQDVEANGPGTKRTGDKVVGGKIVYGKLVPFGGVFDPWLYKNSPTGYMFFSYNFRFMVQGELADQERRRLKRRRYVPRVMAGREAWLLPARMGWMNGGPDAVDPGQWHVGHVAAQNGTLDGMIARYPNVRLVGIDFSCRWTPSSRHPTRG